MSDISVSQPCFPASERDRIEHTSQRLRILRGEWKDDCVSEIKLIVGTERQKAWGSPDLTNAMARQSYEAQSTLYSRRGAIVPAEEDELNLAFEAAFEDTGFWAFGQRLQRDVLSLRDKFLRVSVVDGRLQLRPVDPNYCYGAASVQNPSQPLMLREGRRRYDRDAGTYRWVWDEVDLRDSKRPRFRLVDAESDSDDDVTAKYLGHGELVGDDYLEEYGNGNGEPLMPYIGYHAAHTGRLFAPYEHRAVWDGQLRLGVFYTFFGHVLSQASWPQRYGMNVEPAGMGTDNKSGSRGVVMDPAVFMKLKAMADADGQFLIGQFGPAASPTEMLQAIQSYERRIASLAGVNPAAVQRVSGDPRSGYALAVNRDEQREAQRRFEPIFDPSDRLLLDTCAAMWAKANKVNMPTSGYRLRYGQIPRSAEEQRAHMDFVTQRLDRGLMSPVKAYMELNPGTTEAEAQTELDKIATTRRALAVA